MTVNFATDKKKSRYLKLLTKINKNLKVLADKEVDISFEENKVNFIKDQKGKVYYVHKGQSYFIGLHKSI